MTLKSEGKWRSLQRQVEADIAQGRVRKYYPIDQNDVKVKVTRNRTAKLKPDKVKIPKTLMESSESTSDTSDVSENFADA